MGCGTAREKLENQMIVYKLARMNIQVEKEKELKKLEEIEGHSRPRRSYIPDYIDPAFAKEKKLYPRLNENKENLDDNKSKKRRKKVTEGDHGNKKKKKKK